MVNQNVQISTEQNNLFFLFFWFGSSPKNNQGNLYYPINEILFFVISAVISGAQELVSIQIFGNAKLEWLKGFFPYRHGVPSHDVLGKLFSRLDPKKFSECFMGRVNIISELTDDEVVAIDGKSICGSKEAEKAKPAFHVVSAYASEKRMYHGHPDCTGV